MDSDNAQAASAAAEAQSFVVRVWLEEEVARQIWRGHITHVTSNTRMHVSQLSQVTEFIMQYLVEMGIEFEEKPPR